MLVLHTLWRPSSEPGSFDGQVFFWAEIDCLFFAEAAAVEKVEGNSVVVDTAVPTNWPATPETRSD